MLEGRFTGMSSRITKPADRPCPECPDGQLDRVLASRTYEVEGSVIEVDGLLPYECPSCHARVWPEAELRRGDEILQLKLRKLAA